MHYDDTPKGLEDVMFDARLQYTWRVMLRLTMGDMLGRPTRGRKLCSDDYSYAQNTASEVALTF